MVRATRIAFGLAAALALACGGTEGQTQWPDVVEAGPDQVQVPDTCDCSADKDCVGKVTVDACTFAKCEQCACVAKAKAAGTTCDDKNAETVKDVCDDKGKCAGHVPVPGDKKCEGPVENCDTSPDDCACASNRICNAGKCIPKPVCGNAKCEPTENCDNCLKDCGCGTGKHCSAADRKCVACADWCKAEARECGEDAGCKCGTCQTGYQCDMVGSCYKSTNCNNAKCDEGEDCLSCPTDCTCPAGKGCQKDQVTNKGVCADCAGICAAVGMQCGVIGSCTCGPCEDGYKCKANKCMADCDWLCYGKVCGQFDGCKCGDNEGACPDGEDCVKGACLKGCGTLCEGKECGWGEDCFCDFCIGTDACHQNTCGPGATEPDANEPNDTPETAKDLGDVTDDDATSAREEKGNIHDGDDFDWFTLHVADTGMFNFLAPVIDLTGLAEDKDLVLVVCYKCDKGNLAGAELLPSDSVYEIDTFVAGARCFETFNWWGESDHIEMRPVCASGGQDDSGTIWVGVYPYEYYDSGSAYTLNLHM